MYRALAHCGLICDLAGGLSIVAEASKKTTGECLGTSHPVAIRGPNREPQSRLHLIQFPAARSQILVHRWQREQHAFTATN